MMFMGKNTGAANDGSREQLGSTTVGPNLHRIAHLLRPSSSTRTARWPQEGRVADLENCDTGVLYW